MSAPLLLAIGAAHVDRRGRTTAPHVPGASNPGTMREEVGGGVFNAVRNARRHGVRAALLSLRGGDVAAETVARAVAEAGIDDLSAVYLDRTTPSYTAILDADGELVTGFADMGLYELGFAKQVRRRKIRDAIAAADAVLIDANMPAAAIERACALASGRPVHAIAISPAKAVRLAGVLDRVAGVFMNAREARAVAGLPADAPVRAAAEALCDRGLARCAITQGGASLAGYDGAGFFMIDPPTVEAIADVTGAGDAVAGVTVAQLLHGMPFREALRRGVAAASLTIRAEPVVADYTDADFAAALALVGEARDMA